MARSPNRDLVDEIGSARAPQTTAVRRPKPDDVPPKKPRKSAGYYTMVIAISVLTCFLFYETVLLISVGMLPTGVAYLIDTHPRRYAAKTVAWANLAGALIVVFELWGADRSIATTLDLLTDPMNWVIMLGAAGIGWGIHFTIPGLVLRYLDLSLEMKRKTLHERQKELEKEWGTDVRANAPLDELASVEAGPTYNDEDEDGVATDPGDDEESEDAAR